MDELHILHKIHTWMWEIEKKYPGHPDTEAAWVDITDSADALAEELGIKNGSYEGMLLADFMHTKERARKAGGERR